MYGQHMMKMSAGDLRKQADPSSSSGPAAKNVNLGKLLQRQHLPALSSRWACSTRHHETQEGLSNLAQGGLQWLKFD